MYWSCAAGAHRRSGRGKFRVSHPIRRDRPERDPPLMRLARFTLLSLFAAIAVVACASEPAAWTYAPAPSKTPIAERRPRPPRRQWPRATSRSARPGRQVRADRAWTCRPARPSRSTSSTTTRRRRMTSSSTRATPTVRSSSTGEQFTGVATKTYDVPALAAGTYVLRLLDPPPVMSGKHDGEVTPARGPALLHGRVPPAGRGSGRPRSQSMATPTTSSSIGPRSTRAVAASRPIGGPAASLGRAHLDRPAARKVGGEIAHELEPSRRRPADRR